MNIKQIRELAQIVSQTGLTALEIVEGDARIRLERGAVVASSMPAAPTVTSAAADEVAPDPGVDFNDVYEVKSPMIGVFYAAPAPDAEPFVKMGQQVKKGDVLCIVEAMKLMNEITADRDGKVVDICVANGDVVEYGQAMFKLY